MWWDASYDKGLWLSRQYIVSPYTYRLEQTSARWPSTSSCPLSPGLIASCGWFTARRGLHVFRRNFSMLGDYQDKQRVTANNGAHLALSLISLLICSNWKVLYGALSVNLSMDKATQTLNKIGENCVLATEWLKSHTPLQRQKYFI